MAVKSGLDFEIESSVLISAKEYKKLVEDSTKLEVARKYAEKVGYADYRAFEVLKTLLDCDAPQLTTKIEQKKINLELPPLAVKTQEPVNEQAEKSEDSEKEEWERYAEAFQKASREDFKTLLNQEKGVEE